MNTTIPPKPWRQLAEPTPVHSLQMLLIDRDDRLLLMHRSATVRSARNVWSFPSGIHEIGETMFNACARELQEELKLDPVPGAMMHLGCYENIMPEPEEPWHWILSVIAVVVPDVTKFVNTEPDKHDEIRCVPFMEMVHDKFWSEFNFHPTFVTWARPQSGRIVSNFIKLLSKTYAN